MSKKRKKQHDLPEPEWVSEPEPPAGPRPLANGSQLEYLNVVGLLEEAFDYPLGRVYADTAHELLVSHVVLGSSEEHH